MREVDRASCVILRHLQVWHFQVQTPMKSAASLCRRWWVCHFTEFHIQSQEMGSSLPPNYVKPEKQPGKWRETSTRGGKTRFWEGLRWQTWIVWPHYSSFTHMGCVNVFKNSLKKLRYDLCMLLYERSEPWCSAACGKNIFQLKSIKQAPFIYWSWYSTCSRECTGSIDHTWNVWRETMEAEWANSICSWRSWEAAESSTVTFTEFSIDPAAAHSLSGLFPLVDLFSRLITSVVQSQVSVSDSESTGSNTDLLILRIEGRESETWTYKEPFVTKLSLFYKLDCAGGGGGGAPPPQSTEIMGNTGGGTFYSQKLITKPSHAAAAAAAAMEK